MKGKQAKHTVLLLYSLQTPHQLKHILNESINAAPTDSADRPAVLFYSKDRVRQQKAMSGIIILYISKKRGQEKLPPPPLLCPSVICTRYFIPLGGTVVVSRRLLKTMLLFQCKPVKVNSIGKIPVFFFILKHILQPPLLHSKKITEWRENQENLGGIFQDKDLFHSIVFTASAASCSHRKHKLLQKNCSEIFKTSKNST